MSDAPQDLDAAADELYAADRDDFTERRNAMAKSVRAAGDRDLAAAVKALQKPTVAAWLVNLAARSDVPELQDLLDVGEELRRAQEELDGQRLRELSQRRQELESAVRRQVRRVAAEHGQDVAGQVDVEVEQTLRAAVADPMAGRAVASGRLTRALAYAGFGDVDLEQATATPLGDTAPPRRRRRTDELAARRQTRRGQQQDAQRQEEQRQEQQRQEQQRQREAARRRADREDAVTRARSHAEQSALADEGARQAQQRAEALVESLTGQLQDARQALAQASKAAAAATRARARAERQLSAAERALAQVPERPDA